jgi:hypothetical protein
VMKIVLEEFVFMFSRNVLRSSLVQRRAPSYRIELRWETPPCAPAPGRLVRPVPPDGDCRRKTDLGVVFGSLLGVGLIGWTLGPGDVATLVAGFHPSGVRIDAKSVRV